MMANVALLHRIPEIPAAYFGQKQAILTESFYTFNQAFQSSVWDSATT
jgi:hypothetical protein